MMNGTKCILIFLLTGALVFGCADQPDVADDAAEQADTMAAMHEGDTPEPSAIVMEPRIPVNAYPIGYAPEGSGDAYVGYMAAPTRPDSVAEAMGLAPGDTTLPGVILIHEWWGLNENIQTMARRVAGEGFRVLAVDLFNRQVAAAPEEAQLLMQQTLQDEEALDANLQAAYDFLTQRYGIENIAVMGWCFGGGMALRAAVDRPTGFDAAVIYYGQVGDYSEEELAAMDMPVLGFFGADDQSIPVEDVEAFEQTLQEEGVEAQIHVYENAGHAFANPSGQNFVEEAARDAWDKTTAFLKQHLYPDA